MVEIDYSKFEFHAVVEIPEDYHVHDFTTRDWIDEIIEFPFTVGRYNEVRVGMYTSELFEGKRNVHVGLDIGAPVGTPVYAFTDGVIFDCGYLSAEGDYGHVIITKHILGGVPLWALYGHLDSKSISNKKPGDIVNSGDVLGWMGDVGENGGWPSHLHFQLSLVEPTGCDMPGVVTESELEYALSIYPDPQNIVGKLY
tara:strand:+ start:149 stop:742 length:594 start_codon:yes stop_codon:yes gene_type:complete